MPNWAKRTLYLVHRATPVIISCKGHRTWDYGQKERASRPISLPQHHRGLLPLLLLGVVYLDHLKFLDGHHSPPKNAVSATIPLNQWIIGLLKLVASSATRKTRQSRPRMPSLVIVLTPLRVVLRSSWQTHEHQSSLPSGACSCTMQYMPWRFEQWGKFP